MPLVGSPKQISWAEDIRSEKYAELEEILTSDNDKLLLDFVKTMADAREWIDCRDMPAIKILKRHGAEVAEFLKSKGTG